MRLHSEHNIRLDLSNFFYCKFCTFRTIPFYVHCTKNEFFHYGAIPKNYCFDDIEF